MRCAELKDDLTELMDKCKEELPSAKAFAAIVAIMETIESGADEREVRNGVLGCGGIESEIAEKLKGLAEDMSSEEKASVGDDVDKLERVIVALENYMGGEYLKEVVTEMRGN